MHIAIGADQGEFNLEGKNVEHLVAQGHQVLDLGIHELKAIDYPDIAESVARTVASGGAKRGVGLALEIVDAFLAAQAQGARVR